MARYDAVIVGSGPAGLEAAVNLKIRGKNFLIFGSGDLSGKIKTAPKIDNYLGLPGISGLALAQKFSEHLTAMGIDVVNEQVSTVYPMGDYFAIASGKRTCEAVSVILAPGVFSTKQLPGESEFLGRGVGYCATCDAPLYRGKTVAILAYSHEAAEEANFVQDIAQ
jgi:thioredoxin reductase (NADPH)